MAVGGFFYFGRSYTQWRSGSASREVTCAHCAHEYEYTIRRTVSGGAASHYRLNDRGAQARAAEKASENLRRALVIDVEPAHCPMCGMYQPEMVEALQARRGKHYDPNKFASERISMPVTKAWENAYASHTRVAYVHFQDVWPTFAESADYQLGELGNPIKKYARRIRRYFQQTLYSSYVAPVLPWLGWTIWISIVAVATLIASGGFR